MDQAIARATGATPSTTPPQNTAAGRAWSILLTSENHGTVGPLGSTFPHAGEKHERVQVVEVVTAGAPPAPGADLAGLVCIDERSALAASDSDLLEVVRAFCAIAGRMRELPEEKRAYYPAPTAEGSPVLAAARAACLARGYTQDGLAVEGVVYPAATDTAGAVPGGYLKDLARQFERAANRHVPLTISPESCALLFRAMTTPPDAAPSAPVGAVPSVDVPELDEVLARIEASWHGCEYDGAGGETLDIGVALGMQFVEVRAAVASQVRAARDAALEEAAALTIKRTAVPRDVLGPATPQMKSLAAAGAQLADKIAALKGRPAISHSGEGATDDAELQQVVGFLMGESDLEGVHFGERHPTKAGAFWWRLNLRAAMHKAAGAHQK